MILKILKELNLLNKMQKIYVIRHPYTEFNIKGISQGHADSSLLPESKVIAEKIGRKLTNLNIKKIHTSDLGRCVETAKIINKILNISILKTQELREQNQGIFNGKRKDFINEKIGSEFEKPDFIPKNGESLNQVKNRILNFIKKLPEETVLLVTHDGCVRSILSKIYNCEIMSEKCKTDQKTINVFEIDNGKLSKFN